MKKNIFIFTVSIMTVMGVCSVARADIPSMEYMVLMSEAKLDKVQDAEMQDKILIVGKDGEIIPSKITQQNSENAIDDNAILLRKLQGNPDDKNKVLTLNEDGTVLPLNTVDADKGKVLTVAEGGVIEPKFVSVPIGQTGTGGAASIWIEE